MSRYIVQNYMRSRVPKITDSATLGEAIKMLLDQGSNGLIVVSASELDKVAGIVSSRNVIEAVVPDYLETDRSLGAFEAEDVFLKRVKEVAGSPISNIMTTKVHAVKPTDTLMEAITLLSDKGIRQLPVVDDNEKLVGYISRTDIRKALGDAIKEISHSS